MFEPLPIGRPLDIGFEHVIDLQEGSNPIITTPYRHPKRFKEEIEKTTKEILEMGHIRPSSIPFTSSVVLVKNKYGTMRMFLDYMELNKNTIKNRYPIPRIDEMIDEMHGEVYFSKVYMQSRYHQIQVMEEDIHKTTFRCHYGNYEFLVMPFRLTKALATFQSCANHIFNKHLSKFLFMFFDDVVI